MIKVADGDTSGNGDPDGLVQLSSMTSTSASSGPASDVSLASSSVSTTSSTASVDQLRRVIAQMKTLKIAFSPDHVKPVKSPKTCHADSPPEEPGHAVGVVGTDSPPLTPFQRMKALLESNKKNKNPCTVKETNKVDVEAPRGDKPVNNGKSSSLVLPQYATRFCLH